MAYVSTLTRVADGVPGGDHAHWFLRLPLAAIMLQQALMKLPFAADDAAGFGVPFVLWILSGLSEFFVFAALIIGGVLRSNVFGDLLTRAAGLAVTANVAGVLLVVYWAPPMDLFLGNQLHILLLVGGIYFLLRGNRA